MNEYTLTDYKKLYEEILEMSFDAENFGLFEDITNEDVEKCKFIAAMLEVLNDVPLSRKNHIFKHRKVEFDYCDFLDELEELE